MSPYVAPGVPEKIDTAIEIICEEFHTTETELRSRKRHQHIVMARNLSMIYMKHIEVTSNAIASGCFNRDHATYTHALKTMRNRYQTDRYFRAKVDNVSKSTNFLFEKILK